MIAAMDLEGLDDEGLVALLVTFGAISRRGRRAGAQLDPSSGEDAGAPAVPELEPPADARGRPEAPPPLSGVGGDDRPGRPVELPTRNLGPDRTDPYPSGGGRRSPPRGGTPHELEERTHG